jgi:hypothetical protein
MGQLIRHQHIPKTGSTSTKKFYKDCIVYGYQNGQHTLNADIPEDAISFTVLRDPLERFQSCINYSLRNGNLNLELAIDIIFNRKFTAKQLSDALKFHEINDYPEEYLVFHSMSIFDPFLNVFDEKQNLKATHLINFNNLQTELMELFPDHNYLNFPRENDSSRTIQLSAEHIEQFEYHFAEDIKYYNQTGFKEKL